MFWIRRFSLKLHSELTKLNHPQTGLPCDRACNSNITADHFYSVSTKKRAYGRAGIRNPEPEPETETEPDPEPKK